MERPVDAGNGKSRWQADLKLDKPLPLEDLVWQRVRYRFTYAGSDEAAVSGIESVSRVLRTPELR